MIEALEGIVIFEGLTPEESETIGRLCKLTNVKKDETVFTAGASAHSLFFLRSGEVELRFQARFYSSTVEIPMDRVEPGEVCGWSAMIPPHRYTLSAYATEDSELVQIEQTDLQECCEANIRLGYVVMKNIGRIAGERYERARQMLMREIQHGLEEKDPLK